MAKKVRELTIAEKMAKVMDLRPIDDVFFEVLAKEPGVLQEMLRTILEDDRLTVDPDTIIVQSSERNLYGRSVRLDALCTLGDGTLCNIEVQRSDNDDHFRRVRFNASSITVKTSQTGEDFRDINNVCIVYLSEFDFIGEGKTIYHIDKTIRETGTVVDDGLTEVFVNASVVDRTKISDLMSCLVRKEANDDQFPALIGAVRHLKHDETGVTAVCEVMKKYEDIAKSEGRAEAIFKLFKDGLLNLEVAAKQLEMSAEEFQRAYDEYRER
ncbi:MAG: PD-(D/E)XK nuclease family transposase [Lachnospiraceae bacterium]|nr:PD-(D/E)XK nuclease family transposase [Lachnospiraceae bacterium]